MEVEVDTLGVVIMVQVVGEEMVAAVEVEEIERGYAYGL